MAEHDIPFNRPYEVGTEAARIAEAIAEGQISNGGTFTKRCEAWLQEHTGTARALLTTSCTAALEASAYLVDAGPGDEVIMPSYTFVTTATAFAARGATPVFVDIREDTLNVDEAEVADAVTPRTKAIVAVHYAGVGCEMDALRSIARDAGARLVEDAAQGLMSTWRGEALGAIGDLGTISFHETKNVTCGEGGALYVNDPELVERAEIVKDKGTNRSRFLRGQVDKYTWVDHGSSFGLSDLNAAFLYEQLRHAGEITARRLAIWERYHEAFAGLEAQGAVRRPVIPEGRAHNAHMYYLLAPDQARRDAALRALRGGGIDAVFHYVPLHSSPAGRRLGRAHGDLRRTDDLSGRLLRLPLWVGLEPADVDRVVEAVHAALARPARVA
ncbi:MAG TPA: dTDP-4-amino-4,6-dideoxygalactose transaminase [Capillimicrobium sp.]|nr:dTDP-4-amino-4,6-dideoxygalactose transaminase [Capillimicrobium sp.]